MFWFLVISWFRFSITPHGAIPMLTNRLPFRRGDRYGFKAWPICRVTPLLVPSVSSHAPENIDILCIRKSADDATSIQGVRNSKNLRTPSRKSQKKGQKSQEKSQNPKKFQNLPKKSQNLIQKVTKSQNKSRSPKKVPKSDTEKTKKSPKNFKIPKSQNKSQDLNLRTP